MKARTYRPLAFVSFSVMILSSLMVSSCIKDIKTSKKFDPTRWEKDIQAFEQSDRTTNPPQGGILFIGSSSIKRWDVERFFPGLPVINRGFGGSHLFDAVYYANRIVIPYHPRLIILYAGDNDIKDGKTPSRVFNDLKLFVSTVHRSLPETHIVYISIKPSIKRWHLVKLMRKTNQLIRDYMKHDERLIFVDIDTPMIGQDGKPISRLFVEDGLHLNEDGYILWSSLVRPYIRMATSPE